MKQWYKIRIILSVDTSKQIEESKYDKILSFYNLNTDHVLT